MMHSLAGAGSILGFIENSRSEVSRKHFNTVLKYFDISSKDVDRTLFISWVFL